MLDFFFQGLFNTDLSQVITIGRFLLCMMTALVIGLLLAYSCRHQGRYTKSFLVTLMLLRQMQPIADDIFCLWDTVEREFPEMVLKTKHYYGAKKYSKYQKGDINHIRFLKLQCLL